MNRQAWMMFGTLAMIAVSGLACGPAVSDHDNRIFATPASLKLSAADLSMAYGTDAGAADSRYRGRVMEVSGVIGKVTPGSRSLTLAGGEKGPVVEASLHEDVAAEMLKTLAGGKRITIKCFCEGLNQQVRLKSCVTPDPAR
ncbi:MAG TPA: hypothetical protein VMZ90_04580 [Vicinamibacterales bacterium]|nr:hypothetical protein [Vicinamibacterales bacterium]